MNLVSLQLWNCSLGDKGVAILFEAWPPSVRNLW